MKIAVTDANIFIDIIELQLHTQFFGLKLDIHTTRDVYNELFPTQQEILNIYASVNKLTIHILSSDDHAAIFSGKYPKALSFEDKSVLFLSEKIEGAILLSSDKPCRNYAKTKCIEYHGMLWLFDKFIEEKLITGNEAIGKIEELATLNFMFRNSAELTDEIEKRKKLWTKL